MVPEEGVLKSNRAGSLDVRRSIRRIVIVSQLTGNFDLGDIVMSNSVVRFVRQRFPESRIILFARPDEITRYSDFYARHSWIDEYRSCPALTDRSWRKWLRFYLQLRTLKPDLCVTNRASLPAWFMFLSGIPLRVGLPPANRWLAKFLTHPVAVPDVGTRRVHWTHVAAAYVAALGGSPNFKVQDVVPYVRYDDEKLDLVEAGLPRPVVAMHIGGGMHWNRRWPRESYLQICVALSREFGASIVPVCGDEERTEVVWLTERLKDLCPDVRVKPLVGCPINHVVNVYAQADLYIGNDSGPTHLAVAMGVPVVMLFGPSRYHYVRPDEVDSRHQAVTKHFPCVLARCQLGCNLHYDIASPDYPACTKAVDVGSVWAAVTRALLLEYRTSAIAQAVG
jgi:ADP-heptose:LPS heptosyltransferase